MSARYNDDDANALSVTFVDPSHVSIVAPSAVAPQTISISLSLNGRDYSASATFDVTALPMIATIVPSSGIIGYRYNVSVIDSNFPAGRFVDGYSRCLFTNSLDAVVYSVAVNEIANSTHLSCLVPRYDDTASAMNLSLRLSFGDPSSTYELSDDVFRYRSPPRISSFASNRVGPVSGGNDVFLVGENLDDDDDMKVKLKISKKHS